MDKQTFASIVVKYWYLLEFLGQSDFPIQSREGRELCSKAAKGETHNKQITLYHSISRQVEASVEGRQISSLNPNVALQWDAYIYSSHGVLSDEIQICLGKLERYLFAERLQKVFRQDVELPEKNH